MISFFTLLKTFLPTYLNSSICIPFQMENGTARSSSEAPADGNAIATNGGNTSEKVRHNSFNFANDFKLLLFC